MANVISGEAAVLEEVGIPRQLPYVSQDLDVIDVIAFLWRWRKVAFISAMLGIGCGGLAHYFEAFHNTTTQRAQQWLITLDTDSNLENDLGVLALPRSLMAMLKTFGGAREFYRALPLITKSDNQAIGRWVERQAGGTGLLRSIDANSRQLLLAVELDEPLPVASLGPALLIAINKLSHQFNENYVDAAIKLEKDRMQVVSQLAITTSAALSIFDRRSTLSEAMKKSVASILLNSKMGRVDVEFLLGSVADDEPVKAKILQKYNAELERHENVTNLIGSLRRSAGVESFVRLPELRKVAQNGDANNVTEPIAAPLSLKLKTVLLVGALIGLLGGLCAGLLWDFFLINRERLARALS